MSYAYSAYGLRLQLPFRCPALLPDPTGGPPDVAVEYGAVPRQLGAASAEGIAWQAAPGRFLLRGGPRAGRFLVENGLHITIDRAAAAEEQRLSFFFLDAVLAALLRQRGMLVLHANAAIGPHGAIAVSGDSGAGKSTTLAALLARGCSMLSDDVTALRMDAAGQIQALPGVPQLHLCEDSAAQLGQNTAGLLQQRWQRMKAAIPTYTMSARVAAPLRALYRIEIQPSDELAIVRLEGAEKFAALQSCIYGPILPQEHPAQFPLLAAVAAQVEMFQIRRPAQRWTTDQIAEIIFNG